jgi:anti-sigma factor RsiW
VAAAIAGEPVLAQRVAQQRALRQLLQARFDPVLEEPVPERLHALLATPAVTALDLAQARAQREARRPRRPAWQYWGAQAAAVALGVLLGAVIFTRGGAPTYIEQSGQLLARGALQRALSGRLGEDPPAEGVVIGLTVRTTDGEICRSFRLDSGHAGPPAAAMTTGASTC